ncbi:MAG: hypothetical protein JST87_14060 [Bacteroidetes bacterium]|nr:hypothetical protein [Bacteroidota bacterium]MBS1932918.1 hypothetical protein [Bacteroidota bacterium]
MLIDKLIKRVKALDLNLKGKTVLTEAASGAYIVTPVLAALAGAKVYAFTKTTRYGTVEEIFKNTQALINSATDLPLDVTFVDTLTPEIISQADIITNSGHLRPLNKEKLQYAKDEVVIPLMYEAWEWRDADMDINYIRERGFRLGATNERHPEVDVFNYLGDMAVKQIFDSGTCPYKNKFILLCNNDFGPYIAKVLSKVCEQLAVIDYDKNESKYNPENIEWIGGFPKISIPEDFRDAEAVVFTAYPFDKTWIGNNSEIAIEEIKQQLNDPLILRYAGDVDEEMLDKNNIRYFPKHVHSGHMGILPSAIGNDPIIRLQAGGLKVGEALISGKKEYNNIQIMELI